MACVEFDWLLLLLLLVLLANWMMSSLDGRLKNVLQYVYVPATDIYWPEVYKPQSAVVIYGL